MGDFLKGLNKEQAQAVTHTEGPLLIVAGAGTGKTTVISKKIVWLIRNELAKPEEILALTFMEKAAGEMEERVSNCLPLGAWDLWISTFHSFCEKILRESGVHIGLDPDFELLTETRQWILMKNNWDRFSFLDYYRPLGNPEKFLKSFLKLFSRAKDENILPEKFLDYAEKKKLDLDQAERSGNSDSGLSEEIKQLTEQAKAYHTYQQLLLENNCLDFGDLVVYTLKLFQERPNILKKYQEKFKYILVDEFQDTNWAQYQLIKLLAAPRYNLTVVGDDDQSIFRFRGASMNNILQFKKDFPQSKNISLVKNYRNAQKILDLAYSFIQNNDPNRLEVQLAEMGENLSKKLVAQKDEEALIEVFSAFDLEEEGNKVLEKIISLKNQDPEATWNDFAILVRANETAKNFMIHLERAGVPYIFLASRGLYTKEVILDVLAFLRSLVDRHDNEAFYRFLNAPCWEFLPEELSVLSSWGREKVLSLYETLNQSHLLKISEETQKKIEKVLRFWQNLPYPPNRQPLINLVAYFLSQSGYARYINNLPDWQRQENIDYLNQFYKKIREFERREDDSSVKKFLDDLELQKEAGDFGELAFNPDVGPEAVKILTVHSAKGLEFKYVFLGNLVKGAFPSRNYSDPLPLPVELVEEKFLPEDSQDVHTEEERRLFYVGLTRAKKGLFFSWALNTGNNKRPRQPSPFLRELGLISEEKDKPKPSLKEDKIRFLEEGKPRSTKRKWEIKVPEVFSFSQLVAFEKCPRQYRLTFIDRILTAGNANQVFGKSIHKTLEQALLFYKARQQQKQAALFSVPEKEKTAAPLGEYLSWEKLKEIYQNSWINEWYETKERREEFFQAGLKMLRLFYQENKDKVLPVLLLEKDFLLKLDDDFLFKGQIDRIDQGEKGVILIDYKTGAAKEKLTYRDKRQLLLYQLAVESFLRQPVEKLVFYFLEKGKQLEFQATEKELAKVKKWALDLGKKIREKNFPLSPGPHCQFCDFRQYCEQEKSRL